MTLPPLPPSRTLSRGDDDGPLQLGYTADQMRAYGEACAAAEREACAKVCEAEDQLGLDDERAYNGRLMAAAISARREA